jgi:predicted metal-dependent hydrolase
LQGQLIVTVGKEYDVVCKRSETRMFVEIKVAMSTVRAVPIHPKDKHQGRT